MYNDYEEYMRSVLGYNTPEQNTYEHNYNNVMRVNQNMQEVNHLYPEIYGVVYPLVKRCVQKK